MALYRTICLTFWTDTKIADEFTPEDRYFYLYLFTNPHTNLAGCYEVGISQIANETGYNKDSVERLLKRFSEIHKVAVYSNETKEVLLLNWHKYNWTSSEKFRKPLEAEINKVKEPTFKEYLTKLFNGENVRYGIDTICIGTICTDTSVTVTDTVYKDYVNTNNTNTVSLTVYDTPKEKKAKSTKFVPPTVEEVEAYCRERNNNVDAEKFVAFYESKGWMVGKTKMKNWKMSVVTWEKSDPNYVSKREQEKRAKDDAQRGLVHIDDYTSYNPFGQ